MQKILAIALTLCSNINRTKGGCLEGVALEGGMARMIVENVVEVAALCGFLAMIGVWSIAASGF